MTVAYTYKSRRADKPPTMLDRIRQAYRKMIRDLKRKAITVAGVIATMVALFTGHVFSAIIVGGMTFIFWKNNQGVDELVGKCKCEAV